MTTPLRVLVLEDRPDDAELMVYELRRAGFDFDWTRVETRADFIAALQQAAHGEDGLDLILADYSLPQYDALRALHDLREHGLEIPYIVATGTGNEEAAVECMKQGADDYLLKQHLARLGPAVTQALESKRARDEKRRADEALRKSEERHRLLAAELKTRVKEQEAMLRLSEALLGLLDPQEIAQATFAVIRERLQPDAIGLLVPDAEGSHLELIAGEGWTEELVGRFRLPLEPPDSSCAAQALHTRQPVFVDFSSEEPPFAVPDEIRQAGVVTCYNTPMMAEEQVVGVLTVDSPTHRIFSDDEARFLSLIANQTAIALERARAHQQTVRRAGQLEAIAEVGGLVTTGGDLQTALETLARKIAEATGFEGVGIGLYDAEKKESSFPALFTTRPMKLLEGRKGTTARLEETPVARQLLREKRHILFDDPQNDPRWRESQQALLREDGIQMALTWPLLYGGELIGGLDLFSTQRRTFSPEDIHLLSTLADQTAAAVQNARLFAENLRQLENLTALYAGAQKLSRTLDMQELAGDIARTCVEVFDARLAWLGLAEPDGRVRPLTHFPAQIEYPRQITVRWDDTPEGQGPTGRAIRTGFPVVTADLAGDPGFAPWRETALMEGFCTSAAFPLISHGRPFGSLNLYSDEPDFFAPERVEFFQAYAHQAAAALENARLFAESQRLFEAEQRRAQEAETLRHAGAVVTSTLEQDEAIELILQQLERVVPYDSASVQLLGQGYLEIVGGRGWPDPAAVVGLRFPVPGDNPNTVVIQERHPHILGDALSAYPPFSEEPHSHIRSWLGVPLVAHDRVIGMLAVDSVQPYHFTPDHAQLVAAFADQVAIAIENARLVETLRQSEARYRGLFDGVPVGLYRTTPDGQILDANPALLEMLGYPDLESFLAIRADEVHVNSEDRQRWRDLMDRDGLVRQFETQFRRRDGTVIWTQDSARAVHGADGQVLHYEGSLQDVTARKQAEEEIRLLQTLTQAIGEAPDLQSALETALRRVCEATGWVFGEAWIPNSDETVLEPGPACYGDSESLAVFRQASQELTFPPEVGLPGRVWSSRRPEWIPDVSAEAETVFLRAPIARQADLKAGLGVPIIAGDQAVAVLAFFLSETREEDEHLVELVSAVAAQLGSVIQRKRAEEETQQRLREQEAIAIVATALRTAATRADMLPVILDQVCDLLRAGVTALAMRDPVTGETVIELVHGVGEQATGVRLPPGQGISGHVIATGLPYVSSDALADPRFAAPNLIGDNRAVACVPLITQEQTIGALWTGRTTPFTAEETRILTAVADMAASAMQRASLHEQTQRRLQLISALRTIDMAITASLDLRVTLNVILDQVTSQVGVDAAAVMLVNQYTQVLEHAAYRGFRSDAITRTSLRLGEGYLGRAALEHRTIQIPDMAAVDDFVRAGLLAAEGFVFYHAMPLVVKGQIKGILELFHRSPLAPDQDWLDFLEALAAQAAIAIDNAALFDDLQRANVELALAYDTTLEGWGRALELRDQETEGHTRRVTEMTLRLARAMGLRDAELVHVRRGALLHDIGKMGIPDGILLKPGPLTDEEWEIMRRHPVHAFEMLSPIAYLRPALDIPYCHHEKWNGTGYPRGLKGEQIPLPARIFAVVDVYDALLSDRPYRSAWTEEGVIAYIGEQAGRHFDPQVVEVFLEMVGDGE